MTYRDSYLWRLRQAVGSDLVLMPGAMIALQRDDRPPTRHALELLLAYLDSGTFQVR